ncbi:hypothetical protein NEOC65_001643 [Neochlamydia sp. AcF65]|nr:hypothetical protein [Neochlamydia sp. AcF65]MBS4171383.1 hypothetical protein [Neochlamydia sp. AcF95]
MSLFCIFKVSKTLRLFIHSGFGPAYLREWVARPYASLSLR